MIPSDPPEPNFFWPPKWWRWLMDFWVWCRERQPIPDTTQFEVSETPRGVSFRMREEIVEAVATALMEESFDVSADGYDDPDTPTVAYIKVRKGTVNDLDEDTGLTVTGAETPPTPPDAYWRWGLGASTTTYLVIQASIDTDGTVPDASIYLDSTPDTTAAGDSGTGAPPTDAYRKIAKLETDGDLVLTITQYTHKAQQVFVFVSDWSCTSVTKNAIWTP